MSEVLLSIIMPTYNNEKTILSAISSVCMSNSTEFELIVINDGSTDGTESVIRSINDDRVKLINQENRGVSASRNIGISSSQGRYITFLDCDDLYVPDAINLLLKYIKENNFDLLSFGFYSEKISNNEVVKTTPNSISKRIKVDTAQAEDTIRYFFESSHILLQAVWNKVFKKEIIESNDIKFDEDMSCYEDFTFVLNYLEHTNTIIFLDNILYKYCYYSESNVLEKRKGLDLTNNVSVCYKGFIDVCNKFHYSEEFKNYMNAVFLENWVFVSRKYFMKNKVYSKKERKKAFNAFMNDEIFNCFKDSYLNNMRFYRILFKLNDLGLRNATYCLYKHKLIK